MAGLNSLLLTLVCAHMEHILHIEALKKSLFPYKRRGTNSLYKKKSGVLHFLGIFGKNNSNISNRVGKKFKKLPKETQP